MLRLKLGENRGLAAKTSESLGIEPGGGKDAQHDPLVDLGVLRFDDEPSRPV